MPFLDGVFVLDAGVAAEPGALGDLVEEVGGGVSGHGATGGDGAGGPVVAGLGGAEEGVGDADGEVGVLEHDGGVGFAVEVGVVAASDEGLGLFFFLRLALDEFEDVGVADLEGLHLGGATGFAAGFDDAGDGVVDAHEADGSGGSAAAGEFFVAGAEGGEVGAGTGAELEEHGLAAGEFHDGFHVVVDALDEAGGALGVLVGAFGLLDGAGIEVPAPVVGGALDAVPVVEADVEPDG